MENKRETKVGLLLLVISALLLGLGITFAAFNFASRGNTINEITTGTVTMTYENANNGISIENALPITDEEGKKLVNSDQYFDFVVSINVTGSQSVSYEVTAEKQAYDESKALKNNEVKLYLQRSNDGVNYNDEVLEPSYFTPLSEKDSFGAGTSEMVLDSGTVSSSTEYYYRLRMWVDKDYQVTDVVKYFTVKVNVYGKGNVNVEENSTSDIVFGGKYIPASNKTYKGVMYLDPSNLSNTCNETNVSQRGEDWEDSTDRCMKWYVYNDTGSNYTMILDHNSVYYTTYTYDNYSYEENDNPEPYLMGVDYYLSKNRESWNSILNPRLITADEIATITGNTSFDNTSTDSWYYLESNNQTEQTINPGTGNYEWLYDYNSFNGFWTSTIRGAVDNWGETINERWLVTYDGQLNYMNEHFEGSDGPWEAGVRPVITLPKSIVK